MYNGEFRFLMLNMLNIRKKKNINYQCLQQLVLPCGASCLLYDWLHREKGMQILNTTSIHVNTERPPKREAFPAYSVLLLIFQDVRNWQETVGWFDFFSKGTSGRFSFTRVEMKRLWRQTNIPSTYCSMKPMRPNAPTAFRHVIIWQNVRKCASTLRNALREGRHVVHSEEHRWDDTVFISHPHHFHPCLLWLFTICFTISSLSFFLNGSNAPTFVVCYTCAGCGFICRNASHNFTPACLAVMLTVSLLILCFGKWFYVEELLCSLFQLLSAAVNSRSIIFLLSVWQRGDRPGRVTCAWSLLC